MTLSPRQREILHQASTGMGCAIVKLDNDEHWSLTGPGASESLANIDVEPLLAAGLLKIDLTSKRRRAWPTAEGRKLFARPLREVTQ